MRIKTMAAAFALIAERLSALEVAFDAGISNTYTGTQWAPSMLYGLCNEIDVLAGEGENADDTLISQDLADSMRELQEEVFSDRDMGEYFFMETCNRSIPNYYFGECGEVEERIIAAQLLSLIAAERGL